MTPILEDASEAGEENGKIESGGVQDVGDKKANRFAHQTLRWPATYIHTHTSRLPGRPTKLSTVNSAINIVQHRGREQRHKSDQKQGARPHIFARNLKLLTLAQARNGNVWERGESGELFCNLEIVVEQEAGVRTYPNQTVKLYYLVRQLELTNGQNAMYEHKGTKCAENSASIVRRIKHVKCAKKIQNCSRLQDPTQLLCSNDIQDPRNAGGHHCC